MKIVGIICLMAVGFVVKGQDSAKVTRGKFSLGVSYSGQISHVYSVADEGVRSAKEGLDSMKLLKFGYQVGAKCSYQINNKLALTGGVLFTDRGFQLKASPNFIPEKLNYHFNYVDIPLQLEYTFYAKRNRFYAAAGLSFNSFLSLRITYVDDYYKKHELLDSKNGFNKLGYTLLVGVGHQIELSSRWNFKTELQLNQCITAIKPTPLQHYLNGVGLNFSLMYRF